MISSNEYEEKKCQCQFIEIIVLYKTNIERIHIKKNVVNVISK